MTSAVTSFQNNRYQVLRKLGEGGKGIVFLCQDTTLARRVAIKLIKEEVLDADGLLRFQREVQAMASLVTRTSSLSSILARKAAGISWCWS